LTDLAEETLKIIIPTAGYGTRLRPHTWSKPKPLVSAAGKAVLDHMLEILATAQEAERLEFVFIIGYLGDQIEAYVKEHYPQYKAAYVEQAERRGQSHALAMARQYISGPTIVVFVDTLIDTDLSFLRDEPDQAVAWVKPVEDPRRFGVAVVDEDGYVERLIEKPEDVSNNLAVVGCYYFPRGEDLLAAVDEQLAGDIQTKGEYYLVDAINLMLGKGLRMRTQQVEVWLDAGVPATVLETNRYLLDHGRDNTDQVPAREGVEIVPPVYIAPDAHIEASTIGPHVSVGAGCQVKGSQVKDTVLEPGAQVIGSTLHGSLVGARAEVRNIEGSLNVGDDCQIEGD